MTKSPMRAQTVSEFDYVMTISEKLESGKWIAVVGKEVVAKGDEAKAVYEEARRKFPDREPFLMKVPSEAIMLM
jgi:orotidine-5'-phosphate decarboxylase